MKKAVEYLKDVFGGNLSTAVVNGRKINKLPFYIVNEYRFLEVTLFDKKIILAERSFFEHFTPTQYKKQLNILENAFNQVVVFILPDIEAYNRNRLIKDRINFIIANKQIFVPALIIDLKEYNLSKKPTKHLQPAAQFLLLYHLQIKRLDNHTYKELKAKTGYSYLAISRAIENLLVCDLCKTEGSKEKEVFFEKSHKQLWEKALPYMKNPVIKHFFTDEQVPGNQIYQTNINALAYYTNLNDEKQKYRAIHKDLYRKLKDLGKLKKSSDYEGCYYVEVWNYSPLILSKNGFVDPLSLYLSFRENSDERIQMALEDIIKEQKW